VLTESLFKILFSVSVFLKLTVHFHPSTVLPGFAEEIELCPSSTAIAVLLWASPPGTGPVSSGGSATCWRTARLQDAVSYVK
jgi:hypothetical protein